MLLGLVAKLAERVLYDCGHFGGNLGTSCQEQELVAEERKREFTICPGLFGRVWTKKNMLLIEPNERIIKILADHC